MTAAEGDAPTGERRGSSRQLASSSTASVALDVDEHARAVVADEAGRGRAPPPAIHERAEPDALNGAGDGKRQRHGTDGPQQIRGSGSPTSMSTMRVPPNVVRSTTMPSGRPRSRRSPRHRAERMAAHRAERGIGLARRGRRRRTCPRWRRTAGRCRGDRRRRSPPGSTGSVASSSTTARSASRASSLHTVPRRRGSGRAASGCRARRRAGRSTTPRAARCRSGCRPRARGRRGRASPPCRGRRWCRTRAPRRRVAPARARDRVREGSRPTPAVVMYRPSAAPRSTTLVSPVTMARRRRRRIGHVGDDLAQLVDREALFDTRRPPTATRAAPSTARSLTVPCTARWPIEPPGKRSGCTTKESVLNASRSPPGSVSVAASGSGPGSSLAKASRKTASTSAADALPPAPWASVTTSSLQPRPASPERLDAIEHRRLAAVGSGPRRHRAGHRKPLLHRLPTARHRAPLASPGCGGRCRSATTRQWSMSSLAAIAPPS